MSLQSLLIIFARNPKLGSVKTRLAADVGDDKALDIYKELLHKTRQITEPLAIDKLVAYSDYINTDDLWNGYFKVEQTSGDLGKRMHDAFKIGFDSDYERIIIIGTDCYDLDTTDIKKAITDLAENDAVIGPAEDGGYYLIGLSKMVPEIFQNKSWSTDKLIAETRQEIQNLGLSHTELRTLNDVDHKSDLNEALINLL